MATGYIVEPHTTGPGVSASLRVQNSNSGTSYQIQWRYKPTGGSYSPWWEQNTTRTGLTPGGFTVDFRMKNSGTGHTAPPDEPVTLSSGELETLVVNWS